MSELLESVQQDINRIEAEHPGFRVYTAGGRWFARRHGPLTDQERRTRPQSPLEAHGPDDLDKAISEAEQEGASWD